MFQFVPLFSLYFVVYEQYMYTMHITILVFRYRNKFKNENKKKDQTLFRFEQVVKENGNYNITIFKQ